MTGPRVIIAPDSIDDSKLVLLRPALLPPEPSMVSPARQASLQLLHEIETRGAFSDRVLSSGLPPTMDLRDRNLATEIVYGTLRWQGRLDHVLLQVTSRAWEKIDPLVKVLLRMSVYQMSHMTRVPDHAVVHDAVEMAKRRAKPGVSGFINGVLRRLSRERPWTKPTFEQNCPPWVQVSLPEWLWSRWNERFGPTVAREYALSLNQPPRPAVRVINRPDSERADLLLHGQPSELVPDAFLLSENAPLTDSGVSFQIQDEASQLIPHLFGPLSGCKIWDACAAPGGKSAILCSLSGAAGRVICTEVQFTRAQFLRNALRLARISNFDVCVHDARNEPPFRTDLDAVLADVPCSGLGTLRRNPEIKWRFQPEGFNTLRPIQEAILASVSKAVRTGGMLLYSTCSTEPEENESVVTAFLRAHPSFRLRRPFHPPAIESWIGQDDMLRTFPSTRLWDGFFAVLMTRVS